MYKFNNNNIFTGYIKQLLKSFNLPMCRIYNKNEFQYYKNISGIQYLQNDILKCTGTEQEKTYVYNAIIPNLTKNLQITNTTYDSYTHEYLGDYLRFLRDYSYLDLMSMYNCFSNSVCTNLHINYEVATNQNIIFDTNDPNYKIYAIPVKLFKEYTIALDCQEPIEICCGIYNKTLNTADYVEALVEHTYKRINGCLFNQPILYSNLAVPNYFDRETISKSQKIATAEEFVNNIAPALQSEKDLKLFLKIPFNNNSSIVVLEGNYLHANDSILSPANKINMVHISEPLYCDENGKYIGDDTSLSYETKIKDINQDNIPFLLSWPSYDPTNKNNFEVLLNGDRAGATTLRIGNLDQIFAGDEEAGYVDLQDETVVVPQIKASYSKQAVYRTNKAAVNFKPSEGQDIVLKPISKLQLLQQNTNISYPFADKLIEYLVGNTINSQEEISDNVKRVQTALTNNNVIGVGLPGFWNETIRAELYAYMTDPDLPQQAATNSQLSARAFDILGYVDRTVEKYYKYIESIDEKTGKVTTRSLSDIDIYGEDF